MVGELSELILVEAQVDGSPIPHWLILIHIHASTYRVLLILFIFLFLSFIHKSDSLLAVIDVIVDYRRLTVSVAITKAVINVVVGFVITV